MSHMRWDIGPCSMIAIISRHTNTLRVCLVHPAQHVHGGGARLSLSRLPYTELLSVDPRTEPLSHTELATLLSRLA
jgi:hypothetical protein